MSKGISNFQIENAIAMIGDDDVFPSNHMNKLFNHAAMIWAKEGKNPLVIAKADDSSKGGIHWWSILDIEPRTDIFLFDSFGLNGVKHFIVQDDHKNSILARYNLILMLVKIYLRESFMP